SPASGSAESVTPSLDPASWASGSASGIDGSESSPRRAASMAAAISVCLRSTSHARYARAADGATRLAASKAVPAPMARTFLLGCTSAPRAARKGVGDSPTEGGHVKRRTFDALRKVKLECSRQKPAATAATETGTAKKIAANPHLRCGSG